MYIGVTNDLRRRISEHAHKFSDGFTARYNIDKLVYYEAYPMISLAIAREKEVKKWRREKKNKLVESLNPEWKNLTVDFDGIG
jgi:putative endonuclease